MNVLERYFHGEVGAARAYLLRQLFLLLLALDTWMLMIGHAGRYGAGDFNVAHFGWLQAIQPLPTPALYIGVLALTGLIALVSFFAGHAPVLMGALCVLYTYSWSMSMLDSYQHHYFMSLVLVSMTFFPAPAATSLHPLPPAEEGKAKAKAKKQRARDAVARNERLGWGYVSFVLAALALYLLVEPGEHTWIAFCTLVAALAALTWMRAPVVPEPARARGFGFALLGANIAILYAYTAVAKMDAQWIAGHTMRAISRADETFAPIVAYAQRLGIEPDRFWSLASTAVIPAELVIALGYLLAVVRDRSGARWIGHVCNVICALAISLHAGAEAMGLEIGWFSYYMMLLACAFLLPLEVVDKLATVLTWPARWLTALLAGWEAPAAPLAVGAAVVLAAAGHLVDLPGVLVASSIAGAFALLGVVVVARRTPAAARRWALASSAAGVLMWLAIALSPVRYDYYRYLGGDMSRRGEPERALAAYLKAERYAPEGKSRQQQIDALRRQLGQ